MKTPDVTELARRVETLERKLSAIGAAVVGEVEAWPKTSRLADAPRGVGRRWPKIARAIGSLPYPGARFHVVSRAQWDAYLAASAPATTTANARPWSPGDDLPALKLRAVR